jgi:flagellar basal-body rod protein FlgF
MDPINAIAASGLRARMESLDLLANNIANASTGGYKADREFYSLYVAPEAESNDPDSVMPVIDKPWIDLSQGAITPTGNSLDVALSGRGFFSVQGPSGDLYTRNGGFHRGANGDLVTSDGYGVRGVNGGVIAIPGADPIEIANDGTVTQAGRAIGQLQILDFPGEAGLAKQGRNYFRMTDPTVVPSAPVGTTVEQGKLEASNSSPAESAVRLINIMRQFEMMQKAVSLGFEMNKQVIEQVAKVG